VADAVELEQVVDLAIDSTAPHLHFELRELFLRQGGRLPQYMLGAVRNTSMFVDPFQSKLWTTVNAGMPAPDCE
jgi:murein DD-endopeptidase MepM/ murein hydrolase activator NlpD